MLQLKRLGSHEWEFVHPDGYRDTLDGFHRGCDLYEEGEYTKAQKVFMATVAEIPDHLDGLHHWALVREKSGDLPKAKELWEKAVSMGKKAFPKTFTIGKDTLIWGFIDNRPFLRCLHGLGLAVFKTGDVNRANKIFMELLKLDPNDNQGARASAIESFFYLWQPEDVLKICDSYPYDDLPDTLYGRALAHHKLGNKNKAEKCLKEAIECLPKVAKELTKDKHRKPKSMHPYYIRVGGEDQAYDYWQRNKNYWETSPGAIDLVKAIKKEK